VRHVKFNRTLAKRYHDWMVAMHYAKTTQLMYDKIVRQFVEFLGERSVVAVTHVDIRQFIAYMSENGATLSTVYRELGVLRQFYDFLHLGGLVSYVAPRFVRLRRPWWNTLSPLTESQVRRLISATRTLRERALIEFFYATGCRLNEARHLKIENIDFSSRTARIVGKFGKARIVLLTETAKESLRSYIADRQEGFVFREDIRVQNGCLTTRNGKWLSLWYDYRGSKRIHKSECLGKVQQFPYEAARKMHEQVLVRARPVRPTRKGPLSKMAIQQTVKRIAQRAGLKKVTPHTLRRTFATHLYDHGAGVEVIKVLMGHVWIQTTMKYARISTDRLASTFDRCHPGGGALNGQAPTQ